MANLIIFISKKAKKKTLKLTLFLCFFFHVLEKKVAKLRNFATNFFIKKWNLHTEARFFF